MFRLAQAHFNPGIKKSRTTDSLSKFFCQKAENHRLLHNASESKLSTLPPAHPAPAESIAAHFNNCSCARDVAEALQDLTGGIVEQLQWMMTATTSQSYPPPSSSESSQHAKVSPSALEWGVGIGGTEGVGGGGVVGGWGARGEKQRARMVGWGLAAGSTRPYGWIFDEVVARLAAGQVIGCR